MKRERLVEILNKFPELTITVVGDYCLDKYLYIDSALEEISRETKLPAHQITSRRLSCGGAANVCMNLSKLGVGTINCVSLIGDDGDGLELERALKKGRCNTDGLVKSKTYMTPVYTKPMKDGKELSRLDIRSRDGAAEADSKKVAANFINAAKISNGIIITDQFDQPNMGVINKTVKKALEEAAKDKNLYVLCDSRVAPRNYNDVIVKCNDLEIVSAFDKKPPKKPDFNLIKECMQNVFNKTGRPVIVSCGASGILTFDGKEFDLSPAVPTNCEIDVVGAGDSVSASMTAALCAKATAKEAAELANLVANIVVLQIGTTGAASPEEVLKVFDSIN